VYVAITVTFSTWARASIAPQRNLAPSLSFLPRSTCSHMSRCSSRWMRIQSRFPPPLLLLFLFLLLLLLLLLLGSQTEQSLEFFLCCICCEWVIDSCDFMWPLLVWQFKKGLYTIIDECSTLLLDASQRFSHSRMGPGPILVILGTLEKGGQDARGLARVTRCHKVFHLGVVRARPLELDETDFSDRCPLSNVAVCKDGGVLLCRHVASQAETFLYTSKLVRRGMWVHCLELQER